MYSSEAKVLYRVLQSSVHQVPIGQHHYYNVDANADSKLEIIEIKKTIQRKNMEEARHNSSGLKQSCKQQFSKPTHPHLRVAKLRMVGTTNKTHIIPT